MNRAINIFVQKRFQDIKYSVFFIVSVLSFNSLEANKNLDSLLTVINAMEDDTAKVRLMTELAEHLLEGDPKRGQDLAKKTIELAERINYQKGGRLLLLLMARSEFYMGNRKEAEKQLNSCIQVFIQNKDIEMLARAYYHLGNLNRSNFSGKNAAYYYKRALNLEKFRKDGRRQITVINAFSLDLINDEKYDEAIDLCKEAIKIGEEQNIVKEIYETNYNLGHISMEIQEKSRAIDYFNRALELARKYEDVQKIALIHNGMGIYYAEIKELKQALQHYLLALGIYRKNENINMQGIIFLNMSNLHRIMNLNDKAIDYLDSALTVYEKSSLKFQSAISQVYKDKANIYFNVNNWEKGIENSKVAMNMMEKGNDDRGLVQAYFDLGQAFFNKKLWTEARKYFTKSLDLAQQMNLIQEMSYNYKYLSRLDSCSGDAKSRFRNMHQYYLLRDSLLNTDKKSQQIQEATRYFFNKKITADSLRNQNEALIRKKQILLSNKEIAYEKTVFWVILFTALVFSVILYFLIRKIRITRAQRATIEIQNEEYNVLLKEIHHQVKNNLQVISSIIDLESMQQTDKKSIDSFNDIKSRISSVSLIHGVLYNQDQLHEIEVEPYIQLLVNSIQSMFEGKNIQLHFEKKIDTFSLDTTHLIPVALILTELITNSYKHAVNEKNELSIFITIRQKEHEMTMVYEDSGKGVEAQILEKITSAQTLGLRLIKLLTKQLSGTVEIGKNNGRFGYTFLFKIEKSTT